MNILKKVLCVVLCIIMVQSFAISGFAAEASVPAEDPDADSFFAFDSGVARMDSDGSFTFSFNSSLTSAHFKAKKAKSRWMLQPGFVTSIRRLRGQTLGTRPQMHGKLSPLPSAQWKGTILAVSPFLPMTQKRAILFPILRLAQNIIWNLRAKRP